MESGHEEEKNKQKIKTLLETGAKVTVKSAWLICRTTELRTYLSQLRKDGMMILSEWVERDGKRFKQYWLAPSD